MTMGAAGVVALISFVNYLPPDSVLIREMNPKEEVGDWFTTMKTNAILADIYDAFIAANSKKGTKVKPYPRPKKKQTIGKGAVPISKFWDWWNEGEKR